MIYLMNSAMMPNAGKYTCIEINEADFAAKVSAAIEAGCLVSRIGYPQNIEVIEALTGHVVELSRGQSKFKDGDTALVMRLSYRPIAPEKGAPVDPKDFEYFEVSYSE